MTDERITKDQTDALHTVLQQYRAPDVWKAYAAMRAAGLTLQDVLAVTPPQELVEYALSYRPDHD